MPDPRRQAVSRAIPTLVLGAVLGFLVWVAWPTPASGPPPLPGTPEGDSRSEPAEVRPGSDAGEEPPEEPDGRIRGRVLDSEGHPVEGARVSWFRGASVRTDVDGRFAIPGGPKVRTHLTVRDRRFRELRAHVLSTASGLVFELDRGLSISGRASAADGGGVEGIWVSAGNQAARTDERGFYRITGLKAGEHPVTCRVPRYRFTCEDGPESTGVRRLTLSRPAGSGNADFIVKGRPLEVRVIDGEGRPFPGAEVVAQTVGSHPLRRGTTGSDGRAFTVTSPGGSVAVSASAPGCEPARVVLEPEKWEMRLSVELELGTPGPTAELAVRASDEDGQPFDRLYLSLLDPGRMPLAGYRDLEVDLDDTGAGRLTGLPPGRYTAHVSDARWAPSESGYGLPRRVNLELFRSEAARMELTIPRGGRIRLAVRDGEGNLVNPGQVIIGRKDGGKMDRVEFGTPQGDRFLRAGSGAREVLSLQPLPPGEYRVTARFGSNRDRWLTAFATVTGGKTSELELRERDADGGK